MKLLFRYFCQWFLFQEGAASVYQALCFLCLGVMSTYVHISILGGVFGLSVVSSSMVCLWERVFLFILFNLSAFLPHSYLVLLRDLLVLVQEVMSAFHVVMSLREGVMLGCVAVF